MSEVFGKLHDRGNQHHDSEFGVKTCLSGLTSMGAITPQWRKIRETTIGERKMSLTEP